jgi:hypothetical protein
MSVGRLPPPITRAVNRSNKKVKPMKKERAAPYHKSSNRRGDHPPVSNGLDYAKTDAVQPKQVHSRLSLGHKQTSIVEHQAPSIDKPSRREHAGPVFDPSSPAAQASEEASINGTAGAYKEGDGKAVTS